MAGLLSHVFTPAAPGGAAHAWAATRGLPLAMAASAAAHALVAGFVVLPSPPAPVPRATTSRSPGAMTVSLANPAAPVRLTPPINPLPKKPKRPALPIRSTTRPPAPMQAPPAVPAPAPAAPAPAARFAGLFAPVIQSPLGRSGWGPGPAPRPTAPVDPQVVREQAALALQMSVQSRLFALAENLRSTGHDARCEVIVDTDRRVAQVECAQPSDQAAPWAYLQGLLVAGDVAPEAASRQCFRLAEQQLSMGPCPTEPPTP